MKVVMNIRNSYLFTIAGLLILFAGIFVVSAYGGTDPSVMGHSAGEIEGGGLPSGAVMAFNLTSCPSGWSDMAGASGRVIVGLNTADASFDVLNEVGGEKTHKLTVAEMPSHSHKLGAIGSSPTYARQWGDTSLTTLNSLSKITSYVGGNGVHNNLQPYIVLLYCQKD